MSKKDAEYGLPALTFQEGARLLGLETGAFMIWVMEHARPSGSEWSEWKNGKRALPEKLIRLYLAVESAATAPPPALGSAVIERAHDPSRGPLQPRPTTGRRKVG